MTCSMCTEWSLLFASDFQKIYLRPIGVAPPRAASTSLCPSPETSIRTAFSNAPSLAGSHAAGAAETVDEPFPQQALLPVEVHRLDAGAWLYAPEASPQGIRPVPWR
jgi:hypothetical protein